ncbi:MAG: hypothetical protein KDI36_17000 [Pseudomonadales bacterium]|nr:hypothetical protein [Pseudomonadales bacterium]
MIPHADEALRMLTQRLATTQLPDLKSAYLQSDLMVMTQLLGALSLELGNGIERRLQDIRTMQALLASEQGRALLDDPALLAATPASYSLADVNALHDQLTRALISVHAAAEEAGEPYADFGDQIWGYYEEHAARHALPG